MRTMFFVIEGPDGVGKSTQVERLSTLISKTVNRVVHTTREPTDSPLGSFIRAEHASFSPRGRALAVAADRANHVEETIIPKLRNGDVVISDRYVPSSLVLQRLDGLSLEEIWTYNAFAPAPTLTLILAADPRMVESRLTARGHLTHFEKLSTPLQQASLYENAAEFLQLKGWDVMILDIADMTAFEVSEQIVHLVESKF